MNEMQSYGTIKLNHFKMFIYIERIYENQITSMMNEHN